tara:strand:- start:193 stop:294 length:102 start_codon:yes stop_codon:yes gene_type:complete
MAWMGIFVLGMYAGFFLGIITVSLFRKEFREEE